MSETYKIIKQAKECFLQEKAKGKVHKKIYEAAGITYNLYHEILEFDPVAVSIREPSIEKLKAFIEKCKNPEPEPEPEPPAVKKEAKCLEGDLLEQLDRLIIKFNQRGYCLDVTIRKMLLASNKKA